MERRENTEAMSASAQEIITRMSNYQQILLLAKELEADRIIIHTETINF